MTTKAQDEIILDQMRQKRDDVDRRTFRMLKPANDSIKPFQGIDPKIIEARFREHERRNAEREAAERERRVMESWDHSGVGKRFRESRLDTYETPTEGHRSALAACREAVEGFGGGDGALLLGDPEGGKTHLLCGMLFEAARRGFSVRYITAEDFYLGLRSRMDTGQSESGFIDSLTAPDVLALDDLYCVAAAKSAHDESYQYRMLWTLLDHRYREAKATIASTNKPLSSFKDMIDERTRRRLEAKIVSVPKRMRQ